MRLIAAAATTLALLFSMPAAAAKAQAKAAPAKAVELEPVAPAASSGTVYAAESGFNLQNASVAGFVGGEFGDLDGFYLRADGSIPLMPLSPTIDLIGVAQLSFTHLGADIPYGSVGWNMAKVTAVARAQMALTPELDGFADAGLGFYYGGWKTEFRTVVGYDPITFQPIYGTMTASDTTGGIQMRLAVGGFYHLNPQTDLSAELGLNPYFGDAETTNFFIGAGVKLKL
jgi:hypothetical protein